VTMKPARVRLRRRLLICSAPVTAGALLIVVKLISVVVVGNSAVTSFSHGDGGAIKIDAAVLGVANVVQPGKAPFAAGVAAVLDGRLEEADTDFSAALARSESGPACPERVDLELVRETQGDQAAAAKDRARADERYRSALAVVNQASGSCFADNNDLDAQRQAVRRDTAARLEAKRAGLNALPPESMMPPPPPAPPPPPPALPATVAPDGREIPPRRLDPAGGDPLDKLRQVLQDAAAAVAPEESP
jgi:hypothetical protein